MRSFMLSSLSLSFMALGACGQQPGESLPSSVTRDGSNVVYVDTHDQYRAAYNPLEPDTPLEASAVAAQSKYFKHERKTISLTFDCAWVDEANGMEILDFLARKGIKATFFISGPFIEKADATTIKFVKKMVSDGHEFGNHTVHHLHNTDSAAEISGLKDRWNALLAKMYGSNIPSNAKLKPYWRAPYGEYSDSSLRTAARAGFPYHFGWNVDVRDTTDLPDCRKNGLAGGSFDFMSSMKGAKRCESPQKETELILRYLDVNKKHFNVSNSSQPRFANIVVLSHLSNYYRWASDTTYGLEKLVREANARGFSFAPLGEVFAFGEAAKSESVKCQSSASGESPFRYSLTSNNEIVVVNSESREVARLQANVKGGVSATLGGQPVKVYFDARSGTGNGLYIYSNASNEIFLAHDGYSKRIPLTCANGVIAP